MAMNQVERHSLGRTGEEIANGLVGGKVTAHKAPFDIVDFQMGYAYEVKSMSGASKDLKIHISDESMKRKTRFAKKYGLTMLLIAVVIYRPDRIEVYEGTLVRSVRVSQMRRVN